ncbi:hypothetical protein Droror1_Dr00026960 [Drosera rotundifolia]
MAAGGLVERGEERKAEAGMLRVSLQNSENPLTGRPVKRPLDNRLIPDFPVTFCNISPDDRGSLHRTSRTFPEFLSISP